MPDTGSRQEGVTPYFWSLRQFCQERLLRFLFAEADSETSQLGFAVTVAERYLETSRRTASTAAAGSRSTASA